MGKQFYSVSLSFSHTTLTVDVKSHQSCLVFPVNRFHKITNFVLA